MLYFILFYFFCKYKDSSHLSPYEPEANGTSKRKHACVQTLANIINAAVFNLSKQIAVSKFYLLTQSHYRETQAVTLLGGIWLSQHPPVIWKWSIPIQCPANEATLLRLTRTKQNQPVDSFYIQQQKKLWQLLVDMMPPRLALRWPCCSLARSMAPMHACISKPICSMRLCFLFRKEEGEKDTELFCSSLGPLTLGPVRLGQNAAGKGSRW